MPTIKVRRSVEGGDEYARLQALDCIDWTKSYTCRRCCSVFVLNRELDEKYLKADWRDSGWNANVPDWLVSFTVPCPSCGYEKHILEDLTITRSKREWLHTLKRVAQKRREAEEEQEQLKTSKKSFLRSLFSTS